MARLGGPHHRCDLAAEFQCGEAVCWAAPWMTVPVAELPDSIELLLLWIHSESGHPLSKCEQERSS